MGRISKNNSIYSGQKNVDITNVINNTNIINNSKLNNNTIKHINQSGGSNKKNSKKSNDDSEFGSSDDENEDDEDIEDSDEDNEEDIEEQEDNGEQDNEEQNEDNDDNNSNDTYSEKSDKESNAGDDENNGDEEKNYIDDEETLKNKCYSKYAKVEYDELDFDELFGDETVLVGKNIRVSKPVLTKYEFVRLLTDRTKQLAQGAKQMLKNTQELSSKEIAKLEIKEGVIPLIIERPIPNSKSERWKVSELHIPEHFFSM